MGFKQLIFVSGKGGTGKTTVSLVLARYLASLGKKTLLVELSRQSSAQALLGRPQNVGYKPTASGLGFDWACVTGVDCLVEYVGNFTRLESVTQKLFESSLLKSLINVAPGLNDLSILGKLTSGLRQHGPAFNYDHIVVDAPSTGSFSSLIRAPRILGQSVQRGPLHKQSHSIDQVLQDPALVQYFFVSLFEDLPVDELEDTVTEFKEDHRGQLSIIMNKNIALDQPQASDLSWTKFIEKKLMQGAVQRRRVLELAPACWCLDLIVDDLDFYLRSLEGEVLRPL